MGAVAYTGRVVMRPKWAFPRFVDYGAYAREEHR